MRRDVIILANSRMRSNRCIAGIDAETGEWVRPVYEEGNDGVPKHIRQIKNREPRLLEIVSIPLADDGPNRDVQPENRRILSGEWTSVRTACVSEVARRYCQTKGVILHNEFRDIHAKSVRAMPVQDRC